jgi:D-alanyl-D-alanine carboxypeptidase
MKFNPKGKHVAIAIMALLILGLSFLGYKYFLLSKKFTLTTQEYNQEISILKQNIANLEFEKDGISTTLRGEQEKNTTFENQIKEIAGTVGTLEKLSKTDKELLQKYSKVYFLNEHYIPEEFSDIDKEYVYEKDKTLYVHSLVKDYLERMLASAERSDVPLRVISAYRSFGEQSSLKSGYNITYGSGTANQFSADQGFSEHQLGTTVDLTTPLTGTSFIKFKTTDAYKWLLEHAHEYGFILSYPEGNDYYQFEPWHWRFVGLGLAKKLFEEKQNFYDLDQREIDAYLVNIFD